MATSPGKIRSSNSAIIIKKGMVETIKSDFFQFVSRFTAPLKLIVQMKKRQRPSVSDSRLASRYSCGGKGDDTAVRTALI
jgi:hypothetical protein